MNYTNILLFGLGILGVLLHNLIELNKLNRKHDGNIKLGAYFRLERFTILISIIVVIIALIVKQEIKQIEAAGKWLGVAFVAIGYMGQSLLVFVMGKAEKQIGKNEKDTTDSNSDTAA